MLSNGQHYTITFSDLDGRGLSTADGHVTVVVLITTEDLNRARAVGDHVPDHCLGNANFRMITLLHFRKKHTRFGRAMVVMLMRHRINEEAKRLQTRYAAIKIGHPALQDIYAVADFEGTISAQLGAQADIAPFHVFVFGRDGELLQQWNDVPSTQELAAVLR